MSPVNVNVCCDRLELTSTVTCAPTGTGRKNGIAIAALSGMLAVLKSPLSTRLTRQEVGNGLVVVVGSSHSLLLTAKDGVTDTWITEDFVPSGKSNAGTRPPAEAGFREPVTTVATSGAAVV